MNDDTTFTLRLAQRRKLLGRLLWAGGGTAVLILTLADVVRGKSYATGTAGVLALLACFGSVAVVSTLLIWRGQKLRVVITRSNVVIYNLLSSETVPFDEIAGFEIDHRGGHPRPATLIRLTPGRHGIPRSIDVPAMSADPDGTKWNYGREGTLIIAEITPVIDAMNAELDRRRGAPLTAERLAAAHPAFRSIPYDD